MLKATNIADKILVLGIDGMDPVLTKYHMEQGYMPNLQKFLERGSAREDLVLLGAMPTITPPMWTTLATGAYPMTHGITDFWRQNPEKLDTFGYALDSRLCQAEQVWNVFAEAGKKTLVWHWPGSSWPPSSDSKNLYVVDGTQPEGICMGMGQKDWEYVAVASENIEVVTFKKAAGETSHMCVITDIEMEDTPKNATDLGDQKEYQHQMATAPDIKIIRLPKGAKSDMTAQPLDASLSPIKKAEGWSIAVPDDAKEFIILFSQGLIRRQALLTKNEDGVYDKVAIYKNKKSNEPIVVIKNKEFVEGIVDEAIKKDKTFEVARNMRVLEIAEDGSKVRMWISAGIDIADDSVFSPKSLHKEIIENIGFPPPVSNLGSVDKELIEDCMLENWMRTMRWWADSLHYMIEKKGIEVIFSHVHNDDAIKHMFIAFANGGGTLPAEDYQRFLVEISKQNDYYLGRFLHLLDEGWTIFLISDHGLTCTEQQGYSDYAGAGVDATFMRDWGYTEVLYDDDGNPLQEIDWSKTKAVFTRMNEIYINLKGKYATGIVDPADKYDLEADIITHFYNMKDEKGHCPYSLVLRNKDAAVIGLGGPECGDLIVMQTDRHLGDHGDGLSTARGLAHTSQSPIFAAAGKGIKKNFKTTRVIREVDVAPTVAVLGGVRMPANAEGAPIYQILED